jgi:acetolactate synthase I/III small subunit
MTYTIFALINNRPGVLAQMAALISRRGLTIDKLMLDRAEDNILSSVTLTTSGEEEVVNEMMIQLQLMPDVMRVENTSEEQMSFYIASQINESYM